MLEKLRAWLAQRSQLVFMIVVLGTSVVLWLGMIASVLFLWKWIVL